MKRACGRLCSGNKRQMQFVTLAAAPSLLSALQPSDNLVVNAMHGGGKVLVNELGCTVADDDIAIGSVADRCLLSGVIQTSNFKGVRTVFDPLRTFQPCVRSEISWRI